MKNNILFELHYGTDNSQVFVHKTQICRFNNVFNLTRYFFCLGGKSKDFTKNEIIEIALIRIVYDFSMYHGVTDVRNILHTCEYLTQVY